MGGLCTRQSAADVTAPGAAGTKPVSTTTTDARKPDAKKAHRRESERRGLRQNLVHERKHSSVWDNYEIMKEIGHGMTGKVYQVTHRGTGEKYALKCMEMRRIDVELIDDLRNEIELLKMLDHPNVIKLYEYYEDPDNIYLILEFCDGGELFDRLHQQKGNRYSEAEAARLMFKMCAAIGYCHFMGVSHRDLKLENFIFESKDEASNVKLIDFGLSSKYGATLRRMHTMVGTPYYIAPEVLNQAETGNRGYTSACDCWSLGVIAYMLLSGTPPFKGRRDREVLQAVRRGKYTLSGPKWEAVSEEAKDFIRHLLVYNPAKRMTAEQALKHGWLLQARHAEESRPLDPEVLTSLRDFAKLSAFKRAALEAIAFSMSAQSISHLREQFSKLDKDSSGFVSMVDFMDVLQHAGTSREEAATIFATIDQDHTNVISYTEFLAATISRRLWLSRERIKDAFQRLDVEGTGFITKDNLKELLGDEWTAEKAETMMGEADAKGDGRIDFEEFLGVMTKDLLRGPSLDGTAATDADGLLLDATALGLAAVAADGGAAAAGSTAAGSAVSPASPGAVALTNAAGGAALGARASAGGIGGSNGGFSGNLPTIPSVGSSLDDAASQGGATIGRGILPARTPLSPLTFAAQQSQGQGSGGSGSAGPAGLHIRAPISGGAALLPGITVRRDRSASAGSAPSAAHLAAAGSFAASPHRMGNAPQPAALRGPGAQASDGVGANSAGRPAAAEPAAAFVSRSDSTTLLLPGKDPGGSVAGAANGPVSAMAGSALQQ